jgi:hypothetical protein
MIVWSEARVLAPKRGWDCKQTNAGMTPWILAPRAFQSWRNDGPGGRGPPIERLGGLDWYCFAYACK